ncbi:hypothetical protein ACOME3_005195 [Neoechinorhynchus agilis]
MPELYYIIASLLAVLIQAAVLPAFSVLFTELFEVFTEDHDAQERITRTLAIVIFFIGLLGGFAGLVASYGLGKSGEELTCRMRSVAFKSMVYQDISWFDSDDNRVGALLTRLSLDANQLRGLTGQRLSILLQSIASVLIATIIALVLSWKLTLVMTTLIPLVLFSGLIQGRSMSKKTPARSKEKNFSFEEEAGKVSSEALNNIRTIASLRREDAFINRYNWFYSHVYSTKLWANFKNAFGNGIAQSSIFFIYGVAMGYGMVLLINKDIEMQNVFRTVALLNMVGMSLGRGSAFLVDFDEARDAGISFLTLFKRQPLIDTENPSGITLDEATFEVKFHKIIFSYPTRPDVTALNKMSFTAPTQATTAMVGPSGCGKSTTVSLLLRFYDPTSGRITIDGYELGSLNIQWLRSNIGFVQQEPVLFDLTIKENILYGMPEGEEADDNLIMNAAVQANIHNDVVNLPMGYETRVGSKGTHLSGGQKQRIAIARALIRNPKILLFDEATSALDTASEQIVQAAVDAAQKGRTTITIAHRLSTIKDADQICVCDLGRVIENGSHRELLLLGGLYAKLAEAQNLETEQE